MRALPPLPSGARAWLRPRVLVPALTGVALAATALALSVGGPDDGAAPAPTPTHAQGINLGKDEPPLMPDTYAVSAFGKDGVTAAVEVARDFAEQAATSEELAQAEPGSITPQMFAFLHPLLTDAGRERLEQVAAAATSATDPVGSTAFALAPLRDATSVLTPREPYVGKATFVVDRAELAPGTFDQLMVSLRVATPTFYTDESGGPVEMAIARDLVLTMVRADGSAWLVDNFVATQTFDAGAPGQD